MSVNFGRSVRNSSEPLYLSAATFLTRKGFFPNPSSIEALEVYADIESAKYDVPVKILGGQSSPINSKKKVPEQKTYTENVLLTALIDLKSSGILEKI